MSTWYVMVGGCIVGVNRSAPDIFGATDLSASGTTRQSYQKENNSYSCIDARYYDVLVHCNAFVFMHSPEMVKPSQQGKD